MPTIRLLPDHLVSQIAAGEVVERPASVVKELLENALDAGATRLRVDLDAGGKRRIAVADDGGGMDRDDALLAFDRHATSKIGSFEDLERVGTLGFRGEALAAIAAVARVELTTAARPGAGHRVRLEGGRVVVAEPAARAQGTTVEVASLFFNVPVRRRFLKSTATELRRCLEVLQGYGLARPDVHLTAAHEGRVLLDLVPAGDAAGRWLKRAGERIRQLFGGDLARRLTALESAGEKAGEVLHGFVGDPSTSRGRQSFVFVNRRLLRDRAVLATFYRAVREVWKSEDFPSLFLFLDLPPEDVDVNVHPQKAEVRFRDPGLLERVGAALRTALERVRGEVPAPVRLPTGPLPAPLAWEGLGGRRSMEGAGAGEGDVWRVREAPPPPYGGTSDTGLRVAPPALAPLDRAPVPLSGRGGEPRPFRLLGQYKGALLLLEGPDGLYLIDQHVAHERILYERFRRDLARETTPSQALLEPLLLALPPAEALRLTELAPALAAVGFDLRPLSGREVALAAVPAVLTVEQGEAMVRRLATGGAEEEEDGAAALARRLLDNLAASMACRAAVKMHQPLAPAAMEALISELFRAEDPYACPHGRPIVLQLTDADLERRFGRR
jgi:DNA mismatch repair protein MutL